MTNRVPTTEEGPSPDYKSRYVDLPASSPPPLASMAGEGKINNNASQGLEGARCAFIQGPSSLQHP